MAILFRPTLPIDHTYWIPALKELFADQDLRIEPDTGAEEDIEYIITWKLFENDKERWSNLKAILSLSAGVNQYIGHPEFPSSVALIRMLDPGLKQSMAEYITSFVLRFHRQHDHFVEKSRDGDWDNTIPVLACERTIGFMGMGDLGLTCIDALSPFGFKIQGWSRSAKNIENITCFSGKDDLKDFLKTTDILVCLLPLTPETENILNTETLSLLPKDACLINAARGKHVIDEDLIKLLDEGHLSMVALDVFRKEPLPEDHPFRGHPKIIITPHVAAVTMPQTAGPVLRKSIELLEKGEKSAGLVEMGKGY